MLMLGYLETKVITILQIGGVHTQFFTPHIHSDHSSYDSLFLWVFWYRKMLGNWAFVGFLYPWFSLVIHGTSDFIWISFAFFVSRKWQKSNPNQLEARSSLIGSSNCKLQELGVQFQVDSVASIWFLFFHLFIMLFLGYFCPLHGLILRFKMTVASLDSHHCVSQALIGSYGKFKPVLLQGERRALSSVGRHYTFQLRTGIDSPAEEWRPKLREEGWYPGSLTFHYQKWGETNSGSRNSRCRLQKP